MTSYDRPLLERLAREAGPWTDEDERRARTLRIYSPYLTPDERNELAVLRQREINESIQRRKEKR